jgi:putative flippase GtrA
MKMRLSAAQRVTVIQFTKFGIIGFLGFFVDYGVFHLAFSYFGFGHYGSALFSFPFAATFGWVGNRLYTFRGEHAGHPGAQWVRFLLVTSIGLVLNRGTFSLLTATVPLVYAYPVIGLLAGTAAGMFFNFFVTRRFVFR